MKNDYVTYIIPIWAKSSSSEIESSIFSLISEDYLIREILIVFDGYESFKNEFSIPDIFQNKIKYIYCGVNNGPGSSRNKGAIFARSKYIFFLDCGDRSVSNRVIKQLKSLKNKDVSFGNIKEIFSSGKKMIKRGALSYKKAYRILPYRNPFNNVTMAINTKLFLKIGGYSDLRYGEDWVLMGKIIKYKLNVACLDEILVDVFVGQNFIKRRSGKKFFNDICKCLKNLYELELISKFTYITSLGLQFFFRKLIPNKIALLIYRFLRR